MVLRLPTRIVSHAESYLRSVISLAQRGFHRKGIYDRLKERSQSSESERRAAGKEVSLGEKLERELGEHRLEIPTVARLAPVGIFQTNSKGECIYANDRCCQICGLTPSEVLGYGWSQHLHPEDRARVLQEWRVVVGNNAVFKSEYRFAFNGRTVWVIGEAAPERTSSGKVVGYVGALTDISDRKRAEASLQQSEKRLKMALRTGRTVAWEWEAATNRLVRSENAIELFGLSSSDTGFPSQKFLDAVDPRYREDLAKNAERIQAGERFLQNEFELIRPDGTRLWFASQAEVIFRDGRVERIVGVTRDITLQKRAQESSESARHFLAQTLDALPSHVAILDEMGKILTVNSAWKKFAIQNGFKAENYGIGLNYLRICEVAVGLGREDAIKVANALEELLSGTRAEFYFEYPCHSPTEKRWFVLRVGRYHVDSSTRLFCSHYDVTEIKLGEEALRESEARFRQLADSMPQIVWSATPDGRIDYQNMKFFEQTGLSSEVAADSEHLWSNILHPEDVSGARFRWQQSISTGQPFQMEYRYIDCKRGGYRWHLGRALPVRNNEGQIVRWFGTCTDIEEHKQIEQALETAQMLLSQHAANLEKAVGERTAQLEQSMKQMESFCYSIAHDLRAPLRAMQGFTTALCDDYGKTLDTTGREYAFRIVSSAQRMERLIQDLLNYGRLSHMDIHFEAVDLEKTVRHVLTGLNREIQMSRAMVSVESLLPSVRGNQALIEGVFDNLISNALKFVAPGILPIIRISAEKVGDKIRIRVRDNGIGVEAEHHERIFRVFEKLHGSASEQATGIGLAIVRKSVERMGGQVGIESKPGEGSTFWFDLNASDSGNAD